MRHTNLTLTLSTAVLVMLGFTATAKAESSCSVKTLKGSFAFTATGFLVAPSPLVGPFAAIGVQSFDSQGNTASASTVSIDGAVERVTITGVYSVKADCTGSMTLTFVPSGLVQHFDLVVSANGAKIQAIRTDTGVVGTGVYRRISGGN